MKFIKPNKEKNKDKLIHLLRRIGIPKVVEPNAKSDTSEVGGQTKEL